MRRQGLRHVQAHRLDRDSRQRHGASGGVRGRRLRPREGDRLRVRRRDGTAGHAEVRRGRHPPVLRKRPALPRAVPAMKVLFSWLKEFVDVPGTAADVAARLSVRGFAVEGIDGSGDDAVIDFEVTANRPDCLSVLGLAREVATAYSLPLREPAEDVALASLIPAERSEVSVYLDDPDLGPRYAGA